jgi:hypothetical protein
MAQDGDATTGWARRLGASTGGAALAAATRSIAFLRPASKPLHPVGVTLTGRLTRRGSDEPTGVVWLDEPGQDEVVVRLSRAVGLPSALPDIHGLAMRVLGEETGDLLLASTGWGRLGRYVLTFGMRPEARPLTSLLPYRTDVGAVVLGARAGESGTYELSWARYDGDWHPFATLALSDQPAAEQAISFDPVLHQIPGLAQYPTVVRLREPSYLLARRSRRSTQSRSDR